VIFLHTKRFSKDTKSFQTVHIPDSSFESLSFLPSPKKDLFLPLDPELTLLVDELGEILGLEV